MVMFKVLLLVIASLSITTGAFAESADKIRQNGSVHFMQGDYQSAAQEFTRYLALKPGSAHCHLYRGLAYIAMGNEESGKADIKKALSINPGLSSILDEVQPKASKESKFVQITTKKGVPLRTKKGPVVYKRKG